MGKKSSHSRRFGVEINSDRMRPENAINHGCLPGSSSRGRHTTQKSLPHRTATKNVPQWRSNSLLLLLALYSCCSLLPTICARSTMSSGSHHSRNMQGSEGWDSIPRNCKWQRLTSSSADDLSLATNYDDEDTASDSVSSVSNGGALDSVDKQILSCKLRTIDSVDRLFSNFTVYQTDRITALRLECSDVLFYESSLAAQGASSSQSRTAFLSNLRRLQELQVEYCKIRFVPSLILSNLFDLRKFSLKTHNSDWSAMNLEFHRDSFHGLNNLNVLDLTDNNIWTLPNDVFCPMTTLRQLNLSQNRLTDIAQLGFSDWGKGPIAPGRSCNTGLEILDLSVNSVTNLPDNGFSSLRSLNTLLLQENALGSLADRSFVGLQSLRVLNMSSNRLSALPPELFQSPRILQHLYLQNNSLKVLAPGLLEGLDRLEVLDLSRNELDSEWVNRNTFAGLIRLVVLNLGFNQLTKVDHSVFKGLYSLQILNLEYNRIEIIADYAFSDLKNLHALTLSHNQLKQLDAFHFSDLYVLNQLLLDSNLIEEVNERAFENITHLQDLYLNDNFLDEIPNLARLKFLKTLDLGNNKIKSVRNESFEGLEQLLGLRLTDNLITNISRDAFITLSSLHVLNLASNQIKHVDQSAFISNPTLRAIRLDNNQLEDISSVFTSLSSLVWLNVSDNKLRWFDYSHFPSSLEWLDMHKNNITELGNYFDVGNNLQIKMLDISFNSLKFVTDASIPDSIETIFLNNNDIEDVAPGTFANKHFLQKVVLYGNQLRRLEIAALSLPPVSDSRDIPLFYIGNNPFHCDCNMEWLQRINELSYLRQHPHVPDLDQIMCTMEHNRGPAIRPLIDINPKEFLCKYESHCFALCHCCEFDACDCKMTCPDRCSCYHDHTWSSNIVDCGNADYTEIPSKIPMDATAIYLDGNNLEDMASHQFIGKKKLEILYLNNSNINSLHNGTFNGMPSLKVLHLENNGLKEVRGFELNHLTNLREIDLQNNKIKSLGNQTFTKMKYLERMALAGNEIKDFDLWQQLGGAFASGSLNQVTFDGSRLKCDCDSLLKWRDWQKFSLSSESVNINGFLCNNGKMVGDVMAKCVDNSKNVVFVNNNQINGENLATPNVQRTVLYDNVSKKSVSNSGGGGDDESGSGVKSSGLIGGGYIPLLSAIVAAVIGTALLLTLMCIFRQDVRIWAHAKYGVRLFRDPELIAANYECNKEKLYDGYVVYNIRDSDFTQQILAGELQHNGYSLCLHHRDINVCPFLDSVQSVADISKKIIIVMSLNFVHNEWQQPQFRAALQTLLESVRPTQRRHKFVLILTAPVELIVVDHLMQILLRTCTVICWGEKRFWDKLRYMLPDVHTETHHANHHHIHHHHGGHLQPHHPHNNCHGACLNGKIIKSNNCVAGGGNSVGRNSNLRYTPAPTTLDSWCKLTHPGGIVVPTIEPTATINSAIFHQQQQQYLAQSVNNQSINNLSINNNNNNNVSNSNNASPSASTSNTEDDLSTGSSQHYEAPPSQTYIRSTASSLGHVYSTIPETASGPHSPIIGQQTHAALPNKISNLVTCNGAVNSNGNENGRAYFV